MLRNLSRYRQLNVLSIGALAAIVAASVVQVLDVSDGWRLAGHLIVLACVVGAVGYGVRHSEDKPTWLLPRIVFVFFALGSIASAIGGNYVPAMIGAVLAVILPLFMLDDRWNTLFRYRTEV